MLANTYHTVKCSGTRDIYFQICLLTVLEARAQSQPTKNYIHNKYTARVGLPGIDCNSDGIIYRMASNIAKLMAYGIVSKSWYSILRWMRYSVIFCCTLVTSIVSNRQNWMIVLMAIGNINEDSCRRRDGATVTLYTSNWPLSWLLNKPTA